MYVFTLSTKAKKVWSSAQKERKHRMSVSSFPNQSLLIDADDLSNSLHNVTLLDLRPTDDYALGHIPSAKHIDIYGISLNDTSKAPLEAFLSIFNVLFGSRGVHAERPVVVYDHESGERAARAVWLLLVLGHPNVRLLDGGSGAWIRSGRNLVGVSSADMPIAPDKAPPTPPPFMGNRRLDLLATRFDVHDAIGRDDVIILDVRRESENRGIEKRAQRAGAIPGSVHVFWRDHLDTSGNLRPADEVRALYEASGITPDKTIIVFCQGGYRSANTFITLKALGFQNVQNYAGSWGEWGNRDDSIIEQPE
jgi:thiosulfate/3-mercaptopyruvate sulfurtransferase